MKTMFEAARENEAGYRDAAVEDFACHRCEARIIDVREDSEYNGDLGHIPGAELVPLGALDAEASTWDLETELLIVCRSGARSARAASALARRGFTKVMNLGGGMLAYNQRELPVERDPTLRRPRVTEVRDEVFTCFAGMASEATEAPAEAIDQMFRGMFAEADVPFEQPTRSGLTLVLDRLQQAAQSMGRDPKVVDSHLRHYRDLVAIAVEA